MRRPPWTPPRLHAGLLALALAVMAALVYLLVFGSRLTRSPRFTRALLEASAQTPRRGSLNDRSAVQSGAPLREGREVVIASAAGGSVYDGPSAPGPNRFDRSPEPRVLR
jgi:hypothetical protein